MSTTTNIFTTAIQSFFGQRTYNTQYAVFLNNTGEATLAETDGALTLPAYGSLVHKAFWILPAVSFFTVLSYGLLRYGQIAFYGSIIKQFARAHNLSYTSYDDSVSATLPFLHSIELRSRVRVALGTGNVAHKLSRYHIGQILSIYAINSKGPWIERAVIENGGSVVNFVGAESILFTISGDRLKKLLTFLNKI